MVERGLDFLMEEAKARRNPGDVVLIDRKVSVKDTGLYTAIWMGSVFHIWKVRRQII